MKKLRAIIRLLFANNGWIIITAQKERSKKDISESSPLVRTWAVDYSDHYRLPKAAPADIMVELLRHNLFHTISTLRIEADRLERSWRNKSIL